jgi:hypothetical protein
MKFVFEGKVVYERDDGGAALVCETFRQTEPPAPDQDVGLCVQVRSWDESKQHVDGNKLKGKKVRVTVEVID